MLEFPMRKRAACACAFVFLLPYACVGGDDSVSPPDTGTDATSDTTTPIDAAPDVATTPDATADIGADAAYNPSLYGNLELWVAADVGLALSSGKLTWTDQSPVGHLVQSPNDSSPCHNPTIQSAAINGLQAVAFGGYNDCFTISSGFSDFTNGLSIFVIAQPENEGSNFYGAGSAFIDLNLDKSARASDITFGRVYTPLDTSTGGDFQLQTYNSSTSGQSGLIATGTQTTYTQAVTHLFEVVMPATAEGSAVVGAKLYEDGNVLGATTNNPVGPDKTTRSFNLIGYNYFESTNSYNDYAGLIGEIIVFSRALTDSQRQATETYLKAKWGL